MSTHKQALRHSLQSNKKGELLCISSAACHRHEVGGQHDATQVPPASKEVSGQHSACVSDRIPSVLKGLTAQRESPCC